jgi:hypothetical protein
MIVPFSFIDRFFDQYGRKEPAGPSHVPLSFAKGEPERVYWDFIYGDPKVAPVFVRAMEVMQVALPLTGIYDFSWLVERTRLDVDKSRAALVDVGGGKGQAIKAFCNEFPGLPRARCVLQDLPEALKTVDELDEPEMREVQKVPIDFHKKQPVKNALVYFMRKCMHDYSDVVCVNMMKVQAAAMADDSRFLLNEDVMPTHPTPIAVLSDMMMLGYAGKQRTLARWHELLAEAGLKIARVIKPKEAPSDYSLDLPVLECVKM